MQIAGTPQGLAKEQGNQWSAEKRNSPEFFMKYLFACHITIFGYLFIYLFVCLDKSGLKSSHSGSSSPVMPFWVSMIVFFFLFCYLFSGWRKNMTVLCVSECQYLCACESFSVNHNKHSLFMYNVLWVCVCVRLFSVDAMLKFFIVCVICPSALSPTLWPPERGSLEGRVWLLTMSMTGLTELSGEKERKQTWTTGIKKVNKTIKTVFQQYCQMSHMHK